MVTKICFDIETVRAYSGLNGATPNEYFEAWKNFSERKYPEEVDIHLTYQKYASLYPEFSKVVCIAAKAGTAELVSFTADFEEVSEKFILEAFIAYCETECKRGVQLVGHYIKRFDIPFLIVRLVANKIKIPAWLKMYGVKPWESRHLDTWEIWKGGNFGTSQAANVESICLVLGIESPKAEFSGAEVGNIFYSEDPKRFEKIAKYCERDVLATALMCNGMFEFGMI